MSRLHVALLVLALAVAGVVASSWASGPTPERHSSKGVDRDQAAVQDLPQPRVSGGQRPREFAVDVAIAMYRYDARSPRDMWRGRLFSVAGTQDGSIGAQDIDDVIPDDAQWAEMATSGQRASFLLGTAYVPPLWTQTAAEHPELPDGAVGLTVTGTQVVTWRGGSSRVPVALTLLLLCPPATERCVVSRVPAQVAR
jgi:hypothetical protein